MSEGDFEREFAFACFRRGFVPCITDDNGSFGQAVSGLEGGVLEVVKVEKSDYGYRSLLFPYTSHKTADEAISRPLPSLDVAGWRRLADEYKERRDQLYVEWLGT